VKQQIGREVRMSDSSLDRFFGVVTRPATWLNVLYQVLAFPLGLFYFIFLVVGLAVGLGLVIIWVGIPVLLVVTGAWWLFAAFERLLATHLLDADVGSSPRPWEGANGVWGKLKAHFGSGSTWKDLVFLLAKLLFGVVSFTIVVALGACVAWLFALPAAAYYHFHAISWGSGHGWIPAWWIAVLAVPAGVLLLVASLHVVNAWGWVCARWAELLLKASPQQPAFSGPLAPIVSTSPQASTAPAVPPPTRAAAPAVPTRQVTPSAPAAPAAPAAPPPAPPVEPPVANPPKPPVAPPVGEQSEGETP
jgi:hypothetical protein